ncbi:tryptophan synthase beta subunit-like PLP-dependent enzyme [Lanmaoa asiatica]|nr:tryptophan synthase beta subunit-like PLP-dependent enzyme [Lanmaoa asiatica]
MDIAVSSNFERLLWYLAYEHAVRSSETSKRAAACDQVRDWMAAVKNKGIRRSVSGARECTARLCRRQDESPPSEDTTGPRSYLADPHTAVGLHAAEVFAKSNFSDTVQVVLSTAHPAKFSEAVQRAHSSFDPETVFGDLLSRERRSRGCSWRGRGAHRACQECDRQDREQGVPVKKMAAMLQICCVVAGLDCKHDETRSTESVRDSPAYCFVLCN